MDKPDEANVVLDSQDWSHVEVQENRPPRSVVHSVRMSVELTDRLFREAERRGTTPSEVVRSLVEAGLSAAEESAVVRVADVHRLLSALADARITPELLSRFTEAAKADQVA